MNCETKLAVINIDRYCASACLHNNKNAPGKFSSFNVVFMKAHQAMSN